MTRPLVRCVAAATLFAALGAHLALPACEARAEVVLNEVLYDPEGPDEGAEFVELWNPDAEPRSLQGITVEGADGARPDAWTVVYRGSAADTIGPGLPFLIDGAALTGSLQNGPDGLRLARDGATLDRLGYGDGAALLAEGSAAPDAASGWSLARREDGVDRDDNAGDWDVEAAPTPGRANRPDERLVFVGERLQLDPPVPWPGESVMASAAIVNRGRMAIEGHRWEFLLEVEPWIEPPLVPPAAEQPAVPVRIPGLSLAPGESASVAIPLLAPGDGPFRVRLRTIVSSLVEIPSLADTVQALGRVGSGPVVITEIAFRDAGAGEWVEIWAREPVPDVGTLTLADAASTPRPIDRGPEPRPLAAGGYLVLAQDAARLRDRYGVDSAAVLGVIGGWPSLNDANAAAGLADVVRVGRPDGPLCDAVPYDARAVTRGGTLELLSPDLPGHDPGSWAESVDPAGATPARPNSLRAPPAGAGPRGTLLVASARVLRLSAGAEPLFLRIAPEARGRELIVRVFDLVGRPVRTLVRGQRFASEGVFAWDGRDERGNPVSPGLFVIAAEAARAESGSGPRRSSLPVAVVGGSR